MTTIPMLLVVSRLLLAPVIVGLAWWGGPAFGPALVGLLIIGVLTDIFDGIIARRLGVATDRLRRFDSQADMLFFLSVVLAAVLAFPDVLLAEWRKIAILGGFEIGIYALALIRFQREMSTHAILSKAWGLLLTVAFAQLFLTGATGWTFDLMFVFGLLSQVDVVLIALLLPSWQRDIPSAWHAWRIRCGLPIQRHKLFN
jgi:CDP-diacylglycerol--glycerol-3-phosphate 3-phosphatidyltransferase